MPKQDAHSAPFGEADMNTAGTGIPLALRSSDELDTMSFEALTLLLGGGGAVHVQELDDRIRFEKDALIGRPIILTGWSFSDGDMGTYTVVKVTTVDNQHGFFVDGSTGIKDQLALWTSGKLEGKSAPIYAPKGLRVSRYTKEVDGKPIQAETFYISNEQ